MKSEVALEHTWLKGPNSAVIDYPVHPHVMMNIGRSSNANELHYEMLILFTQFLDDRDIMDIRETFLSMDHDNTGTIEIDELKEAFNKIKKQYDENKEKSDENKSKSECENFDDQNVKSGDEWAFLEKLTHDRLEEILQNVDQDSSGSIEFVEFLTHSLTEKHLCDKNIQVFFDVMLPFEFKAIKNNNS
jgi:Ca2+-binding EF-hand superfamily protein